MKRVQQQRTPGRAPSGRPPWRVALAVLFALGLVIPAVVLLYVLFGWPSPSWLPLAALLGLLAQLFLVLVTVWHIQHNVGIRSALAQSEERFRQIVEHSPMAIFVYRDERFLYANPAGLKVFGATDSDQVVGRPLADFIAPASEELLMQAVALSRVSPEYRENPLVQTLRLDGTERDVATSTMEMNYDGRPARIVFGRDVTESIQAERALRESEQRFRSLFEHTQDALLLLDDQGHCVDANPAACELLQVSHADLLQCGVWDVIPGIDRGNFDAVWGEFLRQESSESEYLVRRQDGRSLIVEYRAVANILPGLHLSIMRDISERKKADSELRESKALLQTVFDNSSNSLFVVAVDKDDQFRYLFVSPAQEKLTGVPAARVIGHGPDFMASRLGGETVESVKELFLECVRQRRPVQKEIQINMNGRKIWLLVIVTPLLDERDMVHRLVGVGVNISAQKRAEHQLREYSSNLENQVADVQQLLLRQERLAALGQLAGGVGHELRNPLSVISNALYMLRQLLPDADARVQDYLELVGQEVHASEKIVRDLLDFGRVQSADRRSEHPVDLIDHALNRCVPPDSVTVVRDVAPELPLVYVDLRQVGQILCNLIENAYQAMPAGGVLTLRVRADGDEVVLSVQDTGLGLESSQIGLLFEPLYTTRPQGMGLGLAISKKLAEVNRGTISVTSRLGVGSTFMVRLPVAGREKAAQGES